VVAQLIGDVMEGRIGPLQRDEFRRLGARLLPGGEGRWHKSRRKTRRSLRKRITWIRARRLAREQWLQSQAYLSYVDDIRRSLDL